MTDPLLNSIDIKKVINLAYEAGRAVMHFYDSCEVEVNYKNDSSPLTLADIKSHHIITNGLQYITPNLPVISEEGDMMPYEQQIYLKYFWLVDPLDGTKEFLKKNGEFTVNISLIRNNEPILGIIYAPALNIKEPNSHVVTDNNDGQGVIYYGYEGGGSYKVTDNKIVRSITANKDTSTGIVIVKSRSHSSSKEEEFYNPYQVKNIISVGSSLKFCMVAEGKAHLYYRNGPTYEWDTASGHAIAKYSDAFVYGLGYNKPGFLNDSFIVSSFMINKNN